MAILATISNTMTWSGPRKRAAISMTLVRHQRHAGSALEMAGDPATLARPDDRMSDKPQDLALPVTRRRSRQKASK